MFNCWFGLKYFVDSSFNEWKNKFVYSPGRYFYKRFTRLPFVPERRRPEIRLKTHYNTHTRDDDDDDDRNDRWIPMFFFTVFSVSPRRTTRSMRDGRVPKVTQERRKVNAPATLNPARWRLQRIYIAVGRSRSVSFSSSTVSCRRSWCNGRYPRPSTRFAPLCIRYAA